MAAAGLERDGTLPREIREQMGMMRRNVELEARLIDDLLDLTRISHGKLPLHPQPVDVHALLRHTLEIVRSEYSGNEIAGRAGFGCPAARHPGRSGAHAAGVLEPAQERAEIHPRRAGPPRAHVERRRRGIVISVSDTGIGIEAELLERIFNAFDQGSLLGDHRFGGLGLGLSISKAIVDLHGG